MTRARGLPTTSADLKAFLLAAPARFTSQQVIDLLFFPRVLAKIEAAEQELLQEGYLPRYADQWRFIRESIQRTIQALFDAQKGVKR